MIKIGENEMDRRVRAGKGGYLVVTICIVVVMGAMIIPAIDKAHRRAVAKRFGTNIPSDKAESPKVENPKAEERPNHIIFKTNYLIISGIEEDPNTELPPNYVILTNEWGGFSFQDGDGITHPFWADEAWETEEKAIRAAWLSHSRRIKERIGQLKPPSYTIVRTNQNK